MAAVEARRARRASGRDVEAPVGSNFVRGALKALRRKFRSSPSACAAKLASSRTHARKAALVWFAKDASVRSAALKHSNAFVRQVAIEALGRLPIELQSQHAGEVAKQLEDPDTFVKQEAIEALGRMPAAVQRSMREQSQPS